MQRGPWVTGGYAWLALAAAITAYEIITPPEHLLTAACERGMERHPVLVRAAIAVTALHLLGLLPERVDPYTRLLGVRKRLIGT